MPILSPLFQGIQLKAKELASFSGTNPKMKGQSERTLDSIKFPSVKAVNIQHRQDQEEFHNKVLWLCGSSGGEVVNEKLREEMQPQSQKLKDSDELQGSALNAHTCQSLSLIQGPFQPICVTLAYIPIPAPHSPWIMHSLHSFSALVFTKALLDEKCKHQLGPVHVGQAVSSITVLVLLAHFSLYISHKSGLTLS